MPFWTFVALLMWPGRPWRIDLLSHFVPHFAAAFVVLGGAMTLSKRTRTGAPAVWMAGLVLTGWHVAACAPPTGPVQQMSGGITIKVIQFNAHSQSSASDGAFVAWLQEQDADLVCLIETPWSFAATHPWVRERYPYRVEPNVQLAWPNLLLSKHPLGLHELEAENPEHMFSFVARRSVTVALPNGAKVLWTAMHPVSPRTRSSWSKSVRELERDAGILARYLAKREVGAAPLPVLITGDFNSAPTGRLHQMFARETGLIGWSPVLGAGTWPSKAGRWLGVPIDRVWTSRTLMVARMEIGPRFASDHLPVVAWLTEPGWVGSAKAPDTSADSGISEPSTSDAR
ncbi:MAG: endonuclease/exonuclease/phosphatase family protein [Phycisphaerales bacterium]